MKKLTIQVPDELAELWNAADAAARVDGDHDHLHAVVSTAIGQFLAVRNEQTGGTGSKDTRRVG